MTNRYGLNRSLGGAILAIAVVALLSDAAVQYFNSRSDAAVASRGHSNSIIRQLDAFRAAMLNQETGIRGYLLTGKESSLQPYADGKAALDQTIAKLRRLVGENQNADQSSRLDEAEKAARHWQSQIGEAVVRLMADPAERPRAIELEASGLGMQDFDGVRAALASIRAVEQDALDRQNVEVRETQGDTNLALLFGTLLTLLICAGMGIAVNRGIVKPLLALANVMRRLSHQDLKIEIPGTGQRNEVGEMARAVEVFKKSLIELERTSLLRATTDTLPAMIGYVDSGRRIGFLNEEFERWFDLKTEDPGELKGKPLAEVFASTPFPGAKRELDAAMAGTETRFDYRLRRRSGERRELEAFYRPHRGTDGSVLGVVTLLTDITERNSMTRRLAQQARDLLRSNEELEQFAYVASHDLKAPLRGIENLVSWIEEDLEGALTGDTRNNMELLKSRVRRLESLLDDLLAYSRAGRVEEDHVSVDTRALVEELATLVSPPEGFAIVAAPDLPTIEAPRAPLTQVFQNLIGNAIKHHDHPADGHVWVESASAQGGTEFIVTDDGPGVPERFRERVFGMFQTLRPRDEVEGSGMGLAIVKKLIERLNGRVWLTDGRDGRGLSVHFIWPDAATRSKDGTHG